MRLGLNQPYFFPYIGHFSLIQHVDRYIIDDVVQFTDKSWMTRNRILNAQNGWQYILVPVKRHSSKSPIYEIEIDNEKKWQIKLLKQMDYYRRAPYFHQVQEVVEDIFAVPCTYLAEFNTRATKKVCAYLDINTPIEVLSQMNLQYKKPTAPDEWGLNISLALPGITEYWNAPGGASFYDRRKYQEAGIEIKFQKMILDEYPQKGDSFEPGLSIIDVMMFNSMEKTRQMMEHYEFV
ncbi:WbqC family protein [Ruthenibacterium lactatiformans]|uniref:Glycine transferase n=1 Tax=Ruthenibacterium lactatiformans TaxID=1550024 RepID=A0A6I3Q8S0_9FIRM|nr:WbqC family protein [Ruthenibacterium lactatiformans]MTS16198.1 glycine transferase [Ruthenibacterium lactatiformans]MTS18917.1 glycine transferase [Ruthenibacterium lactatiformans]MTS35931.1 glycine transferase [Ruthenibacterium lactatiformans]MTS48828.1 glycine transferase [Ruthenibacterium lactatiformans]MTS51464.1 glycine transferase [Ruthenibacterium lactatiformans]